MTRSDRRLIEDYLPVDWLSAEASGEPRTKGHISTLHLWRARRPLVACRAAVYSALVSAPGSAEERKREDNFLKSLCQWGAAESTVQKARRRIGKDRDAPPRVLDLFAGGGAIPLEALRLGCDAYALDLANVTLLVEQEAEAVARDDTRVRSRIKVMVEERLAGHRSAIV